MQLRIEWSLCDWSESAFDKGPNDDRQRMIGSVSPNEETALIVYPFAFCIHHRVTFAPRVETRGIVHYRLSDITQP